MVWAFWKYWRGSSFGFENLDQAGALPGSTLSDGNKFQTLAF